MAYNKKEKRTEYLKKWREKNIERYRKYQREWMRKWWQKNREKCCQHRREYRQKNKEKRRLYRKKYRQKNKERLKQRHQEWREKNKESYNLWCRLEKRRLAKDNPKFRLDRNMGSNIYKALKKRKAGQRWEKLVGYSLKDLIKRLEFNFDKNMSWDNYGSYWWIDHKKPKSLFKYNSLEDQAFKDCWCLANLQPLEKIANIKKGNKY